MSAGGSARIVAWLLALLAAGLSMAAPTNGATVDAAWRSRSEALIERIYSKPRAALDEGMAQLAAAEASGDLRGRLIATIQAAAAAQQLSSLDQSRIRNRLEAAIATARSAGAVQRDLLVDLLCLSAVDNVMLGRKGPAEATLDEAAAVARGLADPSHQSPVSTGRGILAMARGDGAAAAEQFDLALANPPSELNRAVLLLWKAVSMRRFSRPVSGMMRSSLEQLALAHESTAGHELPIFQIMELITRGQSAVILGDLRAAAEEGAQITDFFDAIAAQGYDYPETYFPNVLAQFRREDLLLAERLQRSRPVLLWSVAAITAIICVTLTIVLMQLLQKRRLTGLSTRLQQSNDELQDLAQARARLLAAACHDLRQPAHALGLQAELAMLARASDGATEDVQETKRRLQSIRRSSMTLTDMLGELMDQTRLEGGSYQPELSVVSLQDLFYDAQLQFGDAARRKGLSLLVEDAGLNVRSDRHLLRRIVFNLVSNAVKYTERGQIRVGARRQRDGRVELTVEDTGCGIAAHQLNTVFDDYVRVKSENAQEGLGIGLSLVKRAAELLGHPVALTSTPGHGTRVALTLQEGPPNPAAVPVHAAAAHPGTGQWIAVLEDDAESLRALTLLLAQWGYRILSAASAEALKTQWVAAGSPALAMLLTDLHLGELDGLEQASLIRRWPGLQELPALLVTGDLDPAVVPRAAALGITVNYKPMLPRRLLAFIEEALPPLPSLSSATA